MRPYQPLPTVAAKAHRNRPAESRLPRGVDTPSAERSKQINARIIKTRFNVISIRLLPRLRHNQETMNRRSFMGSLAGFALDPERLLWHPGQRLISIPGPFLTARVLTAFAPFRYEYAVQFDVTQNSRSLTRPTDMRMIALWAHTEKLSPIEARDFARRWLPASAILHADDCIRRATQASEIRSIHYAHYPADLLPPALH